MLLACMGGDAWVPVWIGNFDHVRSGPCKPNWCVNGVFFLGGAMPTLVKRLATCFIGFNHTVTVGL